jgi:hypothetical protein
VDEEKKCMLSGRWKRKKMYEERRGMGENDKKCVSRDTFYCETHTEYEKWIP